MNTNTTNRTYKSYTTYFTYLVLFFVLTIIFPLAPQTANAALLSHQPNNLGLIAYWSFNEGKGTQATDFSGNGNSGTLSGTVLPSWANGKRGGALNFDGSSSYITGAGNALPNVGAAASTTISAWIKPTSTTGTKEIFSKGPSGSCFNYGMVVVNGVLSARNSTNDYALGSASITVNTWQHVVVVFGSAGATGYVNGVQVGTNASGATTSCGTNNWAIGARAYNALSEFFPGIIDDVRIYSRALSASDVSNVYTSGQIVRKNVSNTGLVGYWPINEGKGLQAGDFSGGGNTGTLSGTTLPSWTTGKRGSALSFDGSTSYVTAPTISIPSAISATAWVYSTNFSQNGFVVGKNPVNTQWELFFEGTALKWRGGDTTSINCNVPTNNQWHHIAATQTGTSAILYIDGVQCSSSTITAINNGGGTVDIGRFSGGYYFNGKIDDVRIYNRVLTPAEISTLYNFNQTNLNHNQNSRLTNGLVGFWTFNGADTNTSTSTDVSGNGNDGSISGALPTIGKVGQALKFNGSSDQVNINGSTSLDVTSFSISLWWKGTSLSTWGGPFSNRVASKNGFQFVNDVISTSVFSPHLVVWNGTSETAQFKASSYTIPIPFDSYHHFVWTYTGGTANLYVDGVAQAVTTSAVTTYPQTGITIGKAYANVGGNIDEVRVYNRALSATEAQQLYLMGK